MATRLDSVELDLNLLFLHVKGTWKPDERDRKAAWELYIELATRIPVVELQKGDGILREALNSMYSLFSTTRSVLRAYGPSVAKPHKGGDYSLARLAVNILNFQLRPILAKWHPLLLDFENQREEGVPLKAHEDSWDLNDELRKVLNDSRPILVEYSKYLALAAGVEPLLEENKGES